MSRNKIRSESELPQGSSQSVENIEDRVRNLKRSLDDHRGSLARLRKRVRGPSFYRDLQLQINMSAATKEVWQEGYLHPLQALLPKIRNYDFAASHGIKIPEIYHIWNRLEEVCLKGLPDEFVLKFDGGTSGEGVIPLQRDGKGSFTIISTSRNMSEVLLLEHLQEKVEAKKAWGHLIAEEMLIQSEKSAIPDDVKIYVAYGDILQILLRRVEEHGNQSSVQYKYVDQYGNDLGRITQSRLINPSIPVPEKLSEMVETAKHLSRAAGISFCRVDLYDSIGGVVFGEMTRSPGGEQIYDLDHDRDMGTKWLHASSRLELDLMRGRPFGVLHGVFQSPTALLGRV